MYAYIYVQYQGPISAFSVPTPPANRPKAQLFGPRWRIGEGSSTPQSMHTPVQQGNHQVTPYSRQRHLRRCLVFSSSPDLQISFRCAHNSSVVHFFVSSVGTIWSRSRDEQIIEKAKAEKEERSREVAWDVCPWWGMFAYQTPGFFAQSTYLKVFVGACEGNTAVKSQWEWSDKRRRWSSSNEHIW
jgi:hypothetical protein